MTTHRTPLEAIADDTREDAIRGEYVRSGSDLDYVEYVRARAGAGDRDCEALILARPERFAVSFGRAI